MSGRDPLQALMKKAKPEKFETTLHPEKAAIAAEKFHAVAECLEAGDVLAAGEAAWQAQTLLEVLHALLLQDRVEELRDPKCRAKQEAEYAWRSTLKPSTGEASRMAALFRDTKYHHIATTPPYVPPPAPPKPKVERDGTRYVTVFEAVATDAAQRCGLPVRIEVKHGVSKMSGFMLSVLNALERKYRGEWAEGWRLHTSRRPLPGAPEWSGTRYTEMELLKDVWKRGDFVEQHRIGYRIIATTYSKGQELLDERDGRKTKAASRKKAVAA